MPARLGSREACALAEALPRFTACRKLGLASNKICRCHFDRSTRPTLQSSGQRNCGVGDEAALAIAAVLRRIARGPRLKSNKGMGDVGALALSERRRPPLKS